MLACICMSVERKDLEFLNIAITNNALAFCFCTYYNADGDLPQKLPDYNNYLAI